MSINGFKTQTRVALLVDCDNTSPEILEYALRVVAQFGRVVLRRAYGNHTTLTNKWRDSLVRLAFTPCLQFQYASGKNTSDIALALDAFEAQFDDRAQIFCLVTSDSDFTYLCRKLRERGSTMYIVGEAKTPEALRNACDQFFEWQPPQPTAEQGEEINTTPDVKASVSQIEPSKLKSEPVKQVIKTRPKFMIEAVSLLTTDTPDGRVSLHALGQYLKRTYPTFSPKSYGHSGLRAMVETYDHLLLKIVDGGHWVSLNIKKETTDIK